METWYKVSPEGTVPKALAVMGRLENRGRTSRTDRWKNGFARPSIRPS